MVDEDQQAEADARSIAIRQDLHRAMTTAGMSLEAQISTCLIAINEIAGALPTREQFNSVCGMAWRDAHRKARKSEAANVRA